MYRDDFLYLFDEARQRIIGIPFFMIHNKNTVDFFYLQSKLMGKEIEEPIDIENRYEELKDVIIPDVFFDNGNLILKSYIDDIHAYEDYLFGRIVVDHVSPIYYRDKNIIIINTNSHRFHILFDEKSNNYFLIIYAPRGKYKKILSILSDILYNLGFVIIPSVLEPRRINDIVNELKGDLLDTTLENFPSETISKKRIFGRGYQEDENYKRDSKSGSVYQHRFDYHDRITGVPIVVTISGDGLLRFFNNISYKYFITFIKNNILYRLKRLEKGPYSIPLDTFVLSTLHDDEENDDEIY